MGLLMKGIDVILFEKTTWKDVFASVRVFDSQKNEDFLNHRCLNR